MLESRCILESMSQERRRCLLEYVQERRREVHPGEHVRGVFYSVCPRRGAPGEYVSGKLPGFDCKRSFEAVIGWWCLVPTRKFTSETCARWWLKCLLIILEGAGAGGVPQHGLSFIPSVSPSIFFFLFLSLSLSFFLLSFFSDSSFFLLSFSLSSLFFLSLSPPFLFSFFSLASLFLLFSLSCLSFNGALGFWVFAVAFVDFSCMRSGFAFSVRSFPRAPAKVFFRKIVCEYSF